ncbi:uncharacterized protein LOC123544891 [Mercenaria mercenaria]|uniref:uncharacterized protein LOC123544891 n=1 Tax=Mercenaria mercenaria TaxID=6596 RepID=UPI00234EFBBD|nr:uncharacterized protein LOC123544891 [Mercenaria mercenaria]
MSEIGTSQEDVDILRQPDVCAAVREILQSVLCQSRRTGVHVSIKSTKNSQNSPRKSWFYVKVSTKSAIDRTQLEGKCRNPALYSILEYMQSLENESHLCIQNPCDLEGEGHHSVQQNLLLEGERLKVLHEVKRSKQIEDSTLHLRVHQSVLHMMKACAHIHSHMAQIRIFRPKVDMSFTMKVGEAVSHTVFRVENRKKLSQWLPSVVTDSAFYLQDSDMIAVSQSVTPCCLDPTLINVQVLTAQNEYKNASIKLSPVALYIPVAESESSYSKLTFYGPGYLPLDVNVACTLLEDIEWSKYGLKIDGETKAKTFKGLLPCNTNVTLKSTRSGYDMDHFTIHVFILIQTVDATDIAADYQQVNENLQSVLKEHRHTVISVIQGALDKLLQPVLNKAKNRALVIRSINSICKAVTDIVSMSSNEQFRTTALQCMKVTDTVELGVEMNHKLMDISQRKHPGVWAGHLEKYYSHSKVSGQHLHGVSTGSLSCGTRHDVETAVAEVLDQNKTGEFQVEVTGSVIEANTTLEDKSDDNYDSRNKDRNGNCDVITGQTLKVWCTTKTQNRVNSDTVEQNNESSNKRLETIHVNPDRTPEILKIIEDMEKVSPFHQLGEDSPDIGIDKAAPFHQLVESSQEVSLEKVSPFHQLVVDSPDVGMEKLSPFHQLVEDSQEVGMDMTPDISKITQGMKDVSPFQQLAGEVRIGQSSPQVSEEDPCLPENHLQKVSDSQVPNSRFPESFCLNSVVGLHPYSYSNVQHNQDVIKSSVDRLVPTSDCNKEVDKTEAVLNLQKIVRDKDLAIFRTQSNVSNYDSELINSEDFGPTFEVVSNFVDEVVSLEKSQKFTNKFQYKLSKASECTIKDSLLQSDSIVKDKQSNHLHGNAKQHIKITPDKGMEIAEEKETTSVENDDKIKSSNVENKHPGRENVQALDDLFNDVLIEFGEWLN